MTPNSRTLSGKRLASARPEPSINETLTTTANAGLPDRASSTPMPSSTDQTSAANPTRWRATGAFHATAKSAAISQNPTNGRCTFDISNTRMPLQMQAVTRATASALRDPVSTAAASAPAAHSSMPPAKSAAEMVHLADERDGGAENDRSHAGATDRRDVAAEAVEQGADAVGTLQCPRPGWQSAPAVRSPTNWPR